MMAGGWAEKLGGVFGPELLKVNLDVPGFVVGVQRVLGAEQEVCPVNRGLKRVVVELADLEQVNKFVGGVDKSDRRVRVNDGFKADPCFNSQAVGTFKSCDSVTGQSRAGFLLKRFGVVVTSKGRSPNAAGLFEQIGVTFDRPFPGLGQDLGMQPVVGHYLQRSPRKLVFLLNGLIHVAGKTHEHMSGVAFELAGVTLKFSQDSLARLGVGVKCFTRILGKFVGWDAGNVAILAAVDLRGLLSPFWEYILLI